MLGTPYLEQEQCQATEESHGRNPRKRATEESHRRTRIYTDTVEIQNGERIRERGNEELKTLRLNEPRSPASPVNAADGAQKHTGVHVKLCVHPCLSMFVRVDPWLVLIRGSCLSVAVDLARDEHDGVQLDAALRSAALPVVEVIEADALDAHHRSNERRRSAAAQHTREHAFHTAECGKVRRH